MKADTQTPEFRAWFAREVTISSIVAQTNAITDDLSPKIGPIANAMRKGSDLVLSPADVLFLSECGEDAEEYAQRQTLWALEAQMKAIREQQTRLEALETQMKANKPPEVAERAPGLPYGAFRGLFWAFLFMAIAASAVGLVIAIVERLMR